MSVKLTSTDIAELTAPALDDWLYMVDVSSTSDDAAGDSTRMLAAYSGKQFSGTAFPTSDLWQGMPFHRTDLKMDCFYDLANTQWLSMTEYSTGRVTFSASADAGVPSERLRDDYAHFVTRVNLSAIVSTTNDGSNYWTFTISSRDSTISASTTIFTDDTSDQSTAWVDYDGDPSEDTPANYGQYYLAYAKTGSPGSVTLTFSVNYRLIVT